VSERLYLVAKANRQSEYKQTLTSYGSPQKVLIRRGKHPIGRAFARGNAESTVGAAAGGAAALAYGSHAANMKHGKEGADKLSQMAADEMTHRSMPRQIRRNAFWGKVNRKTGGRIGKPKMRVYNRRAGRILLSAATAPKAVVGGLAAGSALGYQRGSAKSYDRSVKRGDLKLVRRYDKKQAKGFGMIGPKY
jgi:hypothetical protein